MTCKRLHEKSFSEAAELIRNIKPFNTTGLDFAGSLCINALRRFILRFGPLKTIIFDNAKCSSELT